MVAGLVGNGRYCTCVEQQGVAPQESVSRLAFWWARSRWFLPALVVTILLRLRFFFVPLHADELGQFAIARAWRHGADLYRDIWLDRPLGMVMLYRLVGVLGLGNTFGIRLMALVMCLIGSAACGRVAARLGGSGSAFIASFGVAVLVSLPRLDGYMANGELMSGAIGALALAMLLKGSWQVEHTSYRWVYASGIVAGLALSIKQSAFDAFGAGLIVLVCIAVISTKERQARFRTVLAAVAGIATTGAVLVIHGLTVGWSYWWNAMVGFRSSKLGLLSGASSSNLRDSARRAFPALIVLAIVLVVLGLTALKQRRFAVVSLCAAWTVLAGVGFAAGGLFWVHYWLLFLFPAGTALGVLIPDEWSMRSRLSLVAVALVLPAVLGVRAGVSPSKELLSSRTTRKFEHVAAWYNAHSSSVDRVYVQCDGQQIYGLVHSDPPVKYLWHQHIDPVPSRREELAALFRGPDAPRYIMEFQEPAECDPSGVMETVLATRYQQVVVIDGVPIYERKPGA